MAVEVSYTAEQRHNQSVLLKDVFGLRSIDHITEHWSAESTPNRGKAILKLELVTEVDADTLSRLLEGRAPDHEPEFCKNCGLFLGTWSGTLCHADGYLACPPAFGTNAERPVTPNE